MQLLSLYHHLYADDTQLFLSFHPLDFQANISNLQNDSHRSFPGWLLIPYHSIPLKLNVLLIGLKQQLAKIHNPSTSIDTIASYLMNISHSPIRYLHCLNPATITSALFAVSVPTLTFTLPKRLPLPPPSYTPSLTTVTLVSLSPWPVCCLLCHRPWHFTHSAFIMVRHQWLCSKLV